MKTRSLLILILIISGFVLFPLIRTNAEVVDLDCGPERVVVKGRVDSIAVYDNNNNQIGWRYVTVCNVPSSMEVYCCVPLTIE
jgi:hypothetical protein